METEYLVEENEPGRERDETSASGWPPEA
jgi:hypothetical protein